MKIKILSLSILASCLTVWLNAQNNDSVANKKVTVTREFQPTIIEAKKIEIAPKSMKVDIQKEKPVYSEISTPLSIKYNIHKLVAKELILPQSEVYKGFARIGFGNPINTLADFRYPILSDDRNRLDIDFNHLGAFGEKKHSKTALDLKYDRLFETNTLYAELGATYDFFNYYGKSFDALNQHVIPADLSYTYGTTIYKTPLDKTISLAEIAGLPMDNAHWRARAKIGLRSLSLSDNIRYDISLKYNRFFSVEDKIAENLIGAFGKLEIPMNEDRLGIKIDYNIVGYQDKHSQLNFTDTYNVFKLNPYYLIERELLSLRLGVKTGVSIGQGKVFTPSPDIAVEFRVLPEYLALYGGVTGDLTVNSMAKIYDENRWLTPETRLEDTYNPIDAYLGLKLSPAHNLMMDLFGEHKIISNQYFYINRPYSFYSASNGTLPGSLSSFTHNRFDVVYSKATKSSLGMRISWDYKNVGSVYAKGIYNHWSVKEQTYAWQMPKWEADFGANVKILNDFSITTQFLFQDGRYARLTDGIATAMLPIMDLNIGASYAYRDWLSLFLKANNLLNKKYDIYYGYKTQGLNVMAGIAFSF